MHVSPLRQDLPLERVGVKISHEPPTPKLFHVAQIWKLGIISDVLEKLRIEGFMPTYDERCLLFTL